MAEQKQGQEALIANEDLKLKTGAFGINRDTLVDLVTSSLQNRTFDQELIKIENLGGAKKIIDLLHTNGNTGIEGTNDDLQARDDQFGNNQKAEIEVQSFWELLWAALGDLMLRVLIGAAVISITVAMAYPEKAEDRKTGWVDGFAILVAVFVCSVVAAANDYQKEKQFRNLNETAENKKVVQVIRQGELRQLKYTELMVGDLIKIQEGMQLPVDGIIIQASEVKCDESAMTGETDLLKKQSFEECMAKRNQIIEENGADEAKPHDVPTPILLAGTQIVQGEGKFIAIVVGEYSSEGKIQKLLAAQENENTPLQQKLEAIANDIGKFGLISAILIVSVLLIRFIIEYSINGWDHFNGGSIQELLRFLSIGVAIVVVAIPEGLPLSVTISLAYSVKKMLNDQNLVRKLQACETMGGADMICSDKTGTLTQNKMTLQQIWNQKLISLELYDEINLNTIIPEEQTQLLFAQSIACNATALIKPQEMGNKTEISLLNFLTKTKFNLEDLKNQYPIFLRYPLTSTRKRMSTVIEFNGRKRLLIKGASEILLDCCSKYHDFNGCLHDLDNHLKNEIQEQGINEMANHALRTLVIAYKDVTDNELSQIQEDSKGIKSIEKSDLILLCVVGIKDALRKEVKVAVEKCKLAGIKVRMVTGDFKLTARAIAVECGITTPGDSSRLTLEGQEFIQKIGGVVCEQCKTAICLCPRSEQEKSKIKKQNGKDVSVRVDVIEKFDEFKKIVPNLDVLARSRPEDKYALVAGLKQMGHVVAVTGDGTNDAPALKKSDVGFSMGIAGTQVAREASDIVLLDDNFNSIVKAVIWGRNIYDSIKKFLQFQLTVNLVAVSSSLVSAAITKQETLTVIQMLWVNLIMDSLAALALATEPPTEKLLNRKPHKRDEYIISRKMMKHIIGQAIFQMTVLMIFIFAGPSFLPEYEDNLDDHILEKFNGSFTEDIEYLERGGLNMKYSDALNKTGEMKYIRSGRLKMISESGISDGDIKEQFKGQDYNYVVDILGHSRHFTYVFNVFVWMQIFNFFNARKLNDEFNIFTGILSNSFFIIIVAVIVVIEIIVITFGGKAFQCYEWGHGGLTIIQWLICLGFAAISFFISFILKLIPDSSVPEAGIKELQPQNSLVRSLRGSSRIKQQQSMEKQGSQIQQKQRLSAKQIPAESEMAELDLKY